MRSLEEATAGLRPQQLQAIETAIDNADGFDHVDDLAFVSQLLVELMDWHQQTPVGWAVVTAHKALLKMAQNEGVVPRPPRVVHERRSKWDELAAESARYRSNAAALDQALVKERRAHDVETHALRLEISKLRNELEVRNALRPQTFHSFKFLPAPPSRWSRIIRWMRGRS